MVGPVRGYKWYGLGYCLFKLVSFAWCTHTNLLPCWQDGQGGCILGRAHQQQKLSLSFCFSVADETKGPRERNDSRRLAPPPLLHCMYPVILTELGSCGVRKSSFLILHSRNGGHCCANEGTPGFPQKGIVAII